MAAVPVQEDRRAEAVGDEREVGGRAARGLRVPSCGRLEGGAGQVGERQEEVSRKEEVSVGIRVRSRGERWPLGESNKTRGRAASAWVLPSSLPPNASRVLSSERVRLHRSAHGRHVREPSPREPSPAHAHLDSFCLLQQGRVQDRLKDNDSERLRPARKHYYRFRCVWSCLVEGEDGSTRVVAGNWS